jgi:hypothetical protein
MTARLKRGQVVSFTHTDSVLGSEVEGVGVVLLVGGEGEAVTVRPLATYDVQVDPAKVSPVTAETVADDAGA